MKRLRHVISLSPPANTKRLSPDSAVSFVPMEMIKEGLGGIDASREALLADVQKGSYNFFQAGDVLLAKVTPCFENGKKGLAGELLNGIGFATSEVFVIRPNDAHIDRQFLLYLLSSEPFRFDGMQSMTGAGGLKRISAEAILNHRLKVSNVEEQVAIAQFLDRETARIDGLIEKKGRFIELLKEKRAAVITNAVTKGIDGDVSMKDSGQDWIGNIPSDWGVLAAARLFIERDIRSKSGDEEMLTVSHLTGVTPRSQKTVNMIEAETTVGYKICHAGDLVVNTLWAWMGAMGTAPMLGIVSPAYNVYTPKDDHLDPAYVDYLVKHSIFAKEVTRFSKGVWSSRLRLYPEGLREIRMPVPPRSTQARIVEHLNRETRKIEGLISTTNRSIELLKEKRSALITAAVTGKIDVRNAA